MEITKKNIEEIAARPLYGMIVSGTHPNKSIVKTLVLFWTLNVSCMSGLALYELLAKDVDLETLSQILEGLSMLCYVWTKYPYHFVSREEIKILMENIKIFWSSSDLKTDLLINIKRVQNIFLAACVIGIPMFLLRPFYSSSLAIECYVPSFVPFYLFAVCNGLIFLVICAVNTTLETFLMTLMILISLQFKVLRNEILKIRLGNLNSIDDVEECKRKLIRCVKHHQFLLRYVEKFNSVNSYNAFVQIFLTEAVICVELYLMNKNPTTARMFNCAFIIFAVSIQVTILDIYPAEMLTNEASELSSAIYDLDWYSCKSISIRKFLIIMMQGMQNEVKIRGGIFFIMTMRTSTMVFKTAYMMFTFMGSF